MHLNNQPKRIVLVGKEADRTKWAKKLRDEDGYQYWQCDDATSLLNALGILEKDVDVVLSVKKELVCPPQKWSEILRDRTCIVYLQPPGTPDKKLYELAHIKLAEEMHRKSFQQGKDLLEWISSADRSRYNRLCQKIDDLLKEHGIAGHAENFARHMHQWGKNGRKIRCTAYYNGRIVFQWTLHQKGVLVEEVELALERPSPSTFFAEMICVSPNTETTWTSLGFTPTLAKKRKWGNEDTLQGVEEQPSQEDVEPPVIREFYQPLQEDVEHIIEFFVHALARA